MNVSTSKKTELKGGKFPISGKKPLHLSMKIIMNVKWHRDNGMDQHQTNYIEYEKWK